MADEIDKANELAEIMLNAAIQNTKPRMRPTGKCYFCGENLMRDIRLGSLFCGPECREDYETQERMRRINGK